jgi:hypothetical protein
MAEVIVWEIWNIVFAGDQEQAKRVKQLFLYTFY